MDYAVSRAELLEEFGRHDFMKAVEAREFHKWEYDVENLPSGTIVKVVFPGLKTTMKPPRYDYRVDIIKEDVRTTLSHANVVVDIYNKSRTRAALIPDLRTLLANIILEGDVHPYDRTVLLQDYEPTEAPDPPLLDRIEQVHRHLGKRFNRTGNKWDLEVLELVAIVKWIAIQEDINYPMPRLEGRRMPFARYLEAIHCAESDRGIDTVIRRALSHSRPPRWQGVDYGMIERALGSSN